MVSRVLLTNGISNLSTEKVLKVKSNNDFINGCVIRGFKNVLGLRKKGPEYIRLSGYLCLAPGSGKHL